MHIPDFERLVRDTLAKVQKDFILRPLDTDNAIALLMGTAIHESGGLRYIRQINGPALGFFQMEPATLKDLRQNFLRSRPGPSLAVDAMKPSGMSHEDALVGCIPFQIITARMQYYRFPQTLPDDDDGLAKYYKRYWNTALGKATEQDFLNALKKWRSERR